MEEGGSIEVWGGRNAPPFSTDKGAAASAVHQLCHGGSLQFSSRLNARPGRIEGRRKQWWGVRGASHPALAPGCPWRPLASPAVAGQSGPAEDARVKRASGGTPIAARTPLSWPERKVRVFDTQDQMRQDECAFAEIGPATSKRRQCAASYGSDNIACISSSPTSPQPSPLTSTDATAPANAPEEAAARSSWPTPPPPLPISNQLSLPSYPPDSGQHTDLFGRQVVPNRAAPAVRLADDALGAACPRSEGVGTLG